MRDFSLGDERAALGRLRVAHFATRLPVGGMENVVLSLFRGLPSSNYDCSMWCLEDGDVQGREVAARGERYFEFGRSRQRDIGAFVQIARRIRLERVDLLHCHDE